MNGHDQSGVLGQDQRCGEVGGVQQVRATLEETQGNLSMLPRRIDSGVDVREAGAGWGCPEVLPSVAVAEKSPCEVVGTGCGRQPGHQPTRRPADPGVAKLARVDGDLPLGFLGHR